MAEVANPVEQSREVTNSEGKVQKDWSILSEDKGFSEFTGKPVVEKPVAETTITNTPEELEADKTEKENADKLATETQVAKAKELGLSETATQEEIEAAEKLKTEAVADEGFVKSDEINVEKSDNGWVEYAKARGFEITEDTEEAFNDGETKYWKDKEDQIRNEADEEKFLSKYSPEARAQIELLNSGMSFEEIQAPFKQLESFRKMNDAELIRAYTKLEHPNWSDEVLDKEMELMTDEAKAHAAQKFRIEVDEVEAGLKLDHSNRVKKYQENAKTIQTAQKQKEFQSIKDALPKVTEFIGRKITDTDRQYLLNKISNGALETLSPEQRINALMFNEWGPKALEYYKAGLKAELTKENAKAQYNVPPVDQSANNRVVNKVPEGTGPLDGFKDAVKNM